MGATERSPGRVFEPWDRGDPHILKPPKGASPSHENRPLRGLRGGGRPIPGLPSVTLGYGPVAPFGGYRGLFLGVCHGSRGVALLIQKSIAPTHRLLSTTARLRCACWVDHMRRLSVCQAAEHVRAAASRCIIQALPGSLWVPPRCWGGRPGGPVPQTPWDLPLSSHRSLPRKPRGDDRVERSSPAAAAPLRRSGLP
jgi:hypothetical protein